MAASEAISTRNRNGHGKEKFLLRLLSSIGSGILTFILLFQDSALEYCRYSQTTSLPTVKYDRVPAIQGGVVFASAGLVRLGIEAQESRDALLIPTQDASASEASSGGLGKLSFAQLRGSPSLRGAENLQADNDPRSELPVTAVATSFLSQASIAATPKIKPPAKKGQGSSTPQTDKKSVSADAKGEKATTPEKANDVKNGGNETDGKVKTGEKKERSQAEGSDNESVLDISEGEGESGSEKEDESADGDDDEDTEDGETEKKPENKGSKTTENASGAERKGGSAAKSGSKESKPQHVGGSSKGKGEAVIAAKSSKDGQGEASGPPKSKTGSAVTSPAAEEEQKAAKPSTGDKKVPSSSGSHDVGSKGGKSKDSTSSSETPPAAASTKSEGEAKKTEAATSGKKEQPISPHKHHSSTKQQTDKSGEKGSDKRPISAKVVKSSAVQLLDSTEHSGGPKQSPPGSFFVLTNFETRARDRSPGETLKVPRIITEGDHEMMMMSSHQPIVLGSVTPDSDELLHGW